MSLFDKLKTMKLPLGNRGVELTVGQYLTNPSGKNSSHTAQRYIVIAELENKFRKLISKVKIIKFKKYLDNNRIIVHAKIPSESVNGLFYDTVLEFRENKTNSAFKDLLLRFYSNDAHFNFTYGYVANKADLLIDELKKHMPKEALTVKPKNTNFNEVWGFHKASYFLILYLEMSGIKTFNQLKIGSVPLDKTILKEDVAYFDEKFSEYKSLKKETERKAKEEKQRKKEETLNKTKSANKKTVVMKTLKIKK